MSARLFHQETPKAEALRLRLLDRSLRGYTTRRPNYARTFLESHRNIALRYCVAAQAGCGTLYLSVFRMLPPDVPQFIPMPPIGEFSVTPRHTAFRSIAVLFGGNMTASALGALGGLLVARYVGPGEAGRFRSYTIPLTYIAMLHLGTFDGLWRQIPFYHGRNQPERVDALAASAGAWNLAVSVVASSVFLCLSIYGLLRRDTYDSVGWLSQALCCWAIFFGGYLAATYRTIHHFSALARFQLAQALLSFGLVFLVPRFQFVGLSIRSAVPSVAYVWMLNRKRPLRVRYKFDAQALRDVMGVGLPFSMWGSIYTSIWTATESALVLALGGVTSLGLFAAAAVMREAMSVLPLAASQVLTPRIVEAFAREGSVRRATARLMLPTMLLTAGVAASVVVASWLLGILVPVAIPKYVDGLRLMRVCLWFAVIQAASLPLNIIFASGKSWIFGRGVVVGLAVVPVVAYLLVPVLGGVMAVAVGSLAGRAARTAVAYLELAMLAHQETSREGSVRSSSC